MGRWRIDLEYHGAGFVGWQLQPGQRSVQGEVEHALASFLGHPVRIAGSGRTDAGVHAFAQVAVFDTPQSRTPDAVMGALNARLPRDIACVAASEVAPDFDPRRHARCKTYRYAWLDRRARSPLRADRTWHVHTRLDEARMAEAVPCLVGTSDFASFRAVGCAAKSTVRTIQAARVWREGDCVYFEIEGTGFLRHMVRILAGTLTDIGLKKQPVDALATALAAKDRSAAGQTAPACGLALMSVRYTPEDGRAADETAR